MSYDLAVAGAGPAGLMAAKTAAEKGLKVALIEQREDVGQITRACCMQFIMDEGYESETIALQDGKLVFANNGFSVDYSGPTAPMVDKYYISPAGHKIHFAYPDKHPIIIKFNKGLLLKGLLEQCQRLGVDFLGGTTATSVRDAESGVEVQIKTRTSAGAVQAKKLIAADGANATLAEQLGLNKERTYFATALGIIYTVEGLKDFEPTAWKSYYGLAYQSRSPVMISASLYGEKCATLVVIGNQNDPPESIYQRVTTQSPLAYMFEGTKVVHTFGCGVKAYTSLKTPAKGNCMIIGDAAAYVEVQTQGSLMCGFHAGTAVSRELAGEKGFADYTAWWQRTFEFNTDAYLRVAQGYALVPVYSDDELDFLFSLIEDQVLEGTYSQYKSPQLMWDAILKHEQRIAGERPELFAKIKNKNLLTLSETF